MKKKTRKKKLERTQNICNVLMNFEKLNFYSLKAHR